MRWSTEMNESYEKIKKLDKQLLKFVFAIGYIISIGISYKIISSLFGVTLSDFYYLHLFLCFSLGNGIMILLSFVVWFVYAFLEP